MSLVEIYYLGLLIAVPAGMALAMHAANRPGKEPERKLYAVVMLGAAVLWPIMAPFAVLLHLIEFLRLGKLLDKFLGWMVDRITKEKE